MSYSYSETHAFTATHAKHIAAKVATDLKRIQRLYGTPSDNTIQQYESEMIEFLKKGYLKKVTYGFQKDGNWIEPTIQYTSRDLADMDNTDDDPGKIRPGANVDGAYFTSYLKYSDSWSRLSQYDKDVFKSTLPFQRTEAAEPGINGYLVNDKTYSSGDRALDRSTLKSYI